MRSAPLLLFGIFVQLRAAGLELGVRDYLDGVRALALSEGLEPFSGLRSVRPVSAGSTTSPTSAPAVFPRVIQREALIWLCEMLWARTREEAELVRTVVTGLVPPPASVLARAVARALPDVGRPHAGEVTPEPPPHVPIDQAASDAVERRTDDADESRARETQPTDGKAEVGREPDIDRIGVEIARTGHMPLADVDGFRDQAQPTLLQPPEWISTTWLLSLWRRFTMPTGVVDPVEVDVPATLARMAATGVMLAPVMKKRRRNAAALAVLLDTGAGMAPWLPAVEPFAASLQPSQSRLKQLRLGYFSLSPGRSVFTSPELRHAVPVDDFLRGVQDRPLLILGEAGAARAQELAGRRRRLSNFFVTARRVGVRPIVWINPMPRRHWAGSLMPDVARQAGVEAFEFLPEELLRAVDVLRGVA